MKTKFLLALAALLFSAGVGNQAGLFDRPATATSGGAVVERVVDGDTIVLVGGEKIRLIGPNTPEVVAPNKPVECYGHEASAFTKKLLPKGTRVDLAYDAEHNDRYGRTLAYVTKTETGEFVNAELLRQGYAVPLIIKPNVAHAGEFKELAAQAERNRLGLWGACPQ